MAKDVLIIPASGLVDFKDTLGVSDAAIQLDDFGNLNITNIGGDLNIGNAGANLYIGDGTNSADVIFEQNGAVRALTGKTLTLGQADSSLKLLGTITSALNINPGVAVTGINLNNNSIVGVNGLSFSDPGPGEGFAWVGGNGWQVYESPNDLTTNSGGNLQFVTGSTRRATFNTSGQLDLPVATGTPPLVVTSTTAVTNLNADLLDGQHGAYYQTALGFTPVQQGGGTGQGTNKTYIGWATDGSGLLAQVDVTNFGNTWPISISKNAANVTGIVAVANGGTGATTASGAIAALGAYASTNPSGYTSNTGTVTSVGGTGSVSGLTLSGTVTTTGNLSLGGTLAVLPSNFASQTANTVLAAPTGAAGTPTFRSLVAADVPTLNQNTTGSAATLTTGRTVALTGDVTYTSGSFTGAADVTGVATLASVGTAGTYTKVTTDVKGRVTSGTSLTAADIPELTLEKLPTSAFKRSVRVATTANITLSGTQTIDGIAVVAGDRVLVKNQTTASQNGIYVVAAGAWARAADSDSVGDIASALVNIDSGTTNGSELWTNTFRGTDTLGTTSMNWYEVLYNTGSWSISVTGSSASTTGNAATVTNGVYTTGTQSIGGIKTFTNNIRCLSNTVAASNIDCSLGNYFSKIITANTTFTVSNVPINGVATAILLDLNNGGAFAVTWWANLKWAAGMAPSLTASGRDTLGFFTYDNGTTWTGLVLGKDIK